MKIILTAILLLLASSIYMYAQIGINNTGAAPHSSAMLDVNSANKGLLLPRTANPTANIANPAAGLMTYNTATNTPNYYNGTSWQNLIGGPLPSNTFPNSVYFGSPTNTKYEGTGSEFDNYTWTVPAGVSKIWFEMWSSGGSGPKFSLTGYDQVGGESGGYLSGTTPVIPGEIITVYAGKGKKIIGNTTGIASYIFRSSLNVTNIIIAGDNFSLNENCSLINFTQRNLGEFIKKSNYYTYNTGSEPIVGYNESGCEGGDAPFGGKGGKSSNIQFLATLVGSTSRTVDGISYWNIDFGGSFPGGGGGRGYYNFGAGGNGFVIIHY